MFVIDTVIGAIGCPKTCPNSIVARSQFAGCTLHNGKRLDLHVYCGLNLSLTLKKSKLHMLDFMIWITYSKININILSQYGTQIRPVEWP